MDKCKYCGQKLSDDFDESPCKKCLEDAIDKQLNDEINTYVNK